MTFVAASSFVIRHSSFVLHYFLRKRWPPLRSCNERNTNGDQEKRKKLPTRERPDQFGIGLAEILNHDSKDRVTNEKQSGQTDVGLTRARPHKPQDCKQHNTLEKGFIKLRWMARRQN